MSQAKCQRTHSGDVAAVFSFSEPQKLGAGCAPAALLKNVSARKNPNAPALAEVTERLILWMNIPISTICSCKGCRCGVPCRCGLLTIITTFESIRNPTKLHLYLTQLVGGVLGCISHALFYRRRLIVRVAGQRLEVVLRIEPRLRHINPLGL